MSSKLYVGILTNHPHYLLSFVFFLKAYENQLEEVSLTRKDHHYQLFLYIHANIDMT